MLKSILLASPFKDYIDRIDLMLFLKGKVYDSIGCCIELWRAKVFEQGQHTLLLFALRCPSDASQEVVLHRISTALMNQFNHQLVQSKYNFPSSQRTLMGQSVVFLTAVHCLF